MSTEILKRILNRSDKQRSKDIDYLIKKPEKELIKRENLIQKEIDLARSQGNAIALKTLEIMWSDTHAALTFKQSTGTKKKRRK